MARALYRKYRSRSLDEVVGQEHVTKVLTAAIKQGKTSHAYLLTGPRGVGKTSVARIMAHALNELPYADEPHLDIIEIDAASNRRIDDIRDLREKIHVAPTSARYKVYIIDEVHMLTGESFNALLKTLEEPPAHAVFILATTELHKVPATIVSRTQRFHFRPASRPAIEAHLKMIAKKEAISIEAPALALIAQRGDGSFRDSISLLDQLASLSDHITPELVESTLGLAPTELVERLVGAVLARDAAGLLDQLEASQSEGVSAATLTDQLINRLSQEGRTQPQVYKLIDGLLEVKQSYHPFMKLTALLIDWIKPAPTTQAARSSVTPQATFSASVSKPKKTTKTATSTTKDSPPVASTAKVETNSQAEEPSLAKASAGNLDWDKVMVALKSRHAPLHSVISRAKVDFDKDSITLTFAYALHRKKLENATYRNQLMTVINHTCGVTPELVITGGSKPTVTDNPATAAVAAIMGGGEVVNA